MLSQFGSSWTSPKIIFALKMTVMFRMTKLVASFVRVLLCRPQQTASWRSARWFYTLVSIRWFYVNDINSPIVCLATWVTKPTIGELISGKLKKHHFSFTTNERLISERVLLYHRCPCVDVKFLLAVSKLTCLSFGKQLMTDEGPYFETISEKWWVCNFSPDSDKDML